MERIKKKNMKRDCLKRHYEKPQMKIVEMELKISILAGSGDPTITNPDMGWGVNEKRGSWGNLWE